VDATECPLFIYFTILMTLHCLFQLRKLNSLSNSVQGIGLDGYAARIENCSENAKSWSRTVERENYTGSLEIYRRIILREL